MLLSLTPELIMDLHEASTAGLSDACLRKVLLQISQVLSRTGDIHWSFSKMVLKDHSTLVKHKILFPTIKKSLVTFCRQIPRINQRT